MQASIAPRDRYCQTWHHACRQATLSVSRVLGAWAYVPPGGYLRWAITCREATACRYGPACQRYARYGAGAARQPYHSYERTQKKEPQLQQVQQAVVKHLHPEHVEVESCHAEELAQHRGLTSELDERWSYVGKKAEQRRFMCFSKTTTMHDLVLGLFMNRHELGVAI